MHATAVVAAFCQAAVLAAQELRWTLPPHGAALYVRDLRMQPPDANAPALPPWYGAPAAPVVFAGELDAKGQRVVEPPVDLRDVWPRLAFDLARSKPGKVRVEVPATGRLRSLIVDATYGPVADDGTQTIELAVADAPGARADAPELASARGALHGSRTLDRANGRLLAAVATGELAFDRPASAEPPEAARKQRFEVVDRLTFDRLLAPTDAPFRKLVDDGIRKALAAIRRDLERTLGDPPPKVDDRHFDAQPGELALALLALVKGGADPNDALVKRGYDDLKKRVLDGTYSLACAILAVEALYTPPSEAQELHAGRLKAPLPREVPAADKDLIAGWTKVLLGNVDASVKMPYVRRWHYGPSNSFDNSNTQYAMLGLYAATLCGVDVSAATWTAAANHWLQAKVQAGDPGAPALLSRTEYEQPKPGHTRTAGGKVPCIGWCYNSPSEPTGSMTCAGVTGLTLCAAALRAQKKTPAKLLHDLDDAARGGLLWLERNFSVRRNPGPAYGWTNWYYYYLYGLERTCELNQVALLGDVDWYFDGAVQLLLQQRPDGSWGGLPDDCFGLLFLKKAALPAITGR
jgi:hypothetical protein